MSRDLSWLYCGLARVEAEDMVSRSYFFSLDIKDQSTAWDILSPGRFIVSLFPGERYNYLKTAWTPFVFPSQRITN